MFLPKNLKTHHQHPPNTHTHTHTHTHKWTHTEGSCNAIPLHSSSAVTQSLSSVQFSTVTQLCPTLCNPIDCSTSGFPVHHQLPEVPQTHVHRIGDAIQPCRNLLSTSPPSFSLPSFRVSSNELVLCIRWPKHWSFSFSISPSNEYSGLISFRIDWFDLLAVQGTLRSLFQHHSPKAPILWCSAFFIV